jgi:hypothetical protein
MSANALATCSFEPDAQPTAATGHQVPGGVAAEIQFREDLWREYRHEALNAGLSTAQASEYASALSPEMGLAAGVAGMAPVGRSWFYQSRGRVVIRTVTSGVIALVRWEKSKATGRVGTSGPDMFAFEFRPWNAGGES